MTKTRLRHGYCAYIADIVGTSRFYVSQILSDPEKHNGEVAELVKTISKNIDAQKAEMKEAVQVLQNQN